VSTTFRFTQKRRRVRKRACLASYPALLKLLSCTSVVELGRAGRSKKKELEGTEIYWKVMIS
jgi:hypothetical protein